MPVSDLLLREKKKFLENLNLANASSFAEVFRAGITNLRFYINNRETADGKSVVADKDELELFRELMYQIIAGENFAAIARDTKILDLHNIFSGLFPEYFKEFTQILLPRFTGLQHLNLSSNFLGENELADLSLALQGIHLKSLVLADNHVMDFSKLTLREKLDVLDIVGNSGLKGAEKIIEGNMVRVVLFSPSLLGSEVPEEILTAISASKGLEEIVVCRTDNFSGNNFDRIKKAVAQNPKLKSISFREDFVEISGREEYSADHVQYHLGDLPPEVQASRGLAKPSLRGSLLERTTTQTH